MQPIREWRPPEAPGGARRDQQHGPSRRLLRQRRHGELVSTYKSKLGEHFATDIEVKDRTFDCIKGFYNTRRHSELDYMSPARYERVIEQRNVA